MVNLLLSISYLVITFLLTILIYKFFGKYGLYIWMSVATIISNLQTIKITEFFGVVISLGNISYGSIFLTTDILNEKYGEKSARTAVLLSFIMQIVFTICMSLFLLYEPSSIDTSQEAFLAIFTIMPRVTIASLLAYITSQMLDARLYAILKEKYNKVWISNNVSTLVSQIVDTIIFVTMAFMFTMTAIEMLMLMLTMIAFKIIIAILDTPFILFSVKIKAKEIE